MATHQRISYPYNGTFQGGNVGEAKDQKSIAFRNNSSKKYQEEYEEAEKAKNLPRLKGTPEFTSLLNERVNIKWAYTIYRELYIIREMYSPEISHAVCGGGKRVFAAGSADWEGNILILNNFTGHYLTSKGSLNHHLIDAWTGAGVVFRQLPNRPTVRF